MKKRVFKIIMTMLRVNMKRIHGFNGGLIIGSIIALLFVANSCNNEKGLKCEFKFISLATGRVVIEHYTLMTKTDEKTINYFYYDDGNKYSYCINRFGGQMEILFNDKFDDIAECIGEKEFENNIWVKCYRVNNEEKIGDELILFYCQEYGVFLFKQTSFIKELIKLDGKTNRIGELVEAIKIDTCFFKYGDRDLIHPPK